MSKYECGIIQDLLALYHDGACSGESRAAVEQHLTECESCRGMARQLGSTEVESLVSEQAGSILKKHGRRQRRVLITVLICAALIILAMAYFWVIQPRIAINGLLNEMLPEVGKGAEYFTEYDVTDSSLAVKDSPNYSIGVPADYEQKELSEGFPAAVYQDSENNDLSVMLMYESSDYSEMSLFDKANFEDEIDDDSYDTIVSELEKWFGALGNGLPDSAYGTLKCVYMLDDSDRSFWNIGQNIAFGIMGIMKQGMPLFGDTVLIYETDEMCGIITISRPTEEQEGYHAIADMFSTDELNTPYTVTIRSESIEEIYAIINSMTIK